MSKVYIIYHFPCKDGFASALVANQYFNENDIETILLPRDYNSEFPKCIEKGSKLYILDFSYKKEIIEKVNQEYNVVILDHHKTAQFDLKNFSNAIFDMNRSGAMLTWNYFYPGKEAPKLIKYIEDRDLWKFNYSETEYINHALDFLSWDFEEWEVYLDDDKVNDLLETGEVISKYIKITIKKMLDNVYFSNISGYSVPTINIANGAIVSQALSYILKIYPESPFAASYYIKENIIKYSLRSRNDFDVSEIAKKYDGGGHHSAAGFIIELKKENSFT